MIAYELDLNLIPGGVLPRLSVSQYDKGQGVTFVLWRDNVAFSLPAGTSVYIEGTKPDGTGFTYECTLENNQPVATITEQMTAVAGCVNCELVMFKDSARQGTINFIIDVEPAALRADVSISETDIPIIERIPEMVAEATAQAQSAEAWATGGEGGEASATNNAKYWAEQSQSYAVGALHWKGNTTFANIPTTDITTGDVYNVTDAFTTDSRFNEGAGIACEAGTNIIYGNNGKWDVQAPPSVHSFNGRKGAVVPASGDYTDAQVSSSAITGKATVKAALQGLNADKQPKTMSQTIAGQTTVEGCLSQLNTDLSALIGSLGDAILGTNNVPSGQSTSIGTRPGFFTYTLPKGKYILIGSLRQDTNLVIYRDVNGMTVTSGTAHVDVLNIDAIRHSEEGLICLAIATITSNSATIMDNAYYCPDGGNIVCNTNCVAIRLK